MNKSFNHRDLCNVRLFLTKYPPDMTLEKLYIKLDQFLIQNSTNVEDILNCHIDVDSANIKHTKWEPIVLKSHAIGDLFNQLEYIICALDQN